MTDALTLERFRDLADAYGGVVERWPEAYREAGLRLAAQPAAAAILARALALDETLDAWTVPATSPALRERIVAGAPTPTRRLMVRTRLWWSGIGLAATLAGAVAGSAAVATVSSVDAPADGGTSFGDVDGQES